MLDSKTLDRIRELNKTGKTQRAIAKILTAEGYRTKSGKPFTQASVPQACTQLLGIRRTKEFTKAKRRAHKQLELQPLKAPAVSLDTALLEIATLKPPDAYKLACLRAITELK